MLKTRGSFLLVLVGMLLIAAACTPAAGTPASSSPAQDETSAAPVTGQDQATATTESGSGTGAGSGSTSDMCANVDTQQLVSAGQALYGQQCASCHGPEGEGMGDFPALANNQDVAGDAAALVQGYFLVEAHPKTMAVNDLAALLTYVRNAFGNTGTTICADLLQPLVPATQ